MTLLDDVKSSVSTHMAGTYETFQPRGVPLPEDIPEGAKAAKLTATSLFIDLRQSSDITNALRRQTAAKMLKAFFSGAVRIINANNGSVRSFNGDGMLALFRDDRRSDNAVKAAMQVKWFVREGLQPRFERYFESNRQAFGASLSGLARKFAHVCGVRRHVPLGRKQARVRRRRGRLRVVPSERLRLVERHAPFTR